MQARRKQALETGLVLTLACIVFSWVFKNNNFLIAGCIIGFVILLVPFFGEKIDWAWRKFAHLMGVAMNTILLSTVYIVILFPLALLSRAFGKLSITRKRKNSSYFEDRNFTYSKKSLEKMW